MDMNKLGTLLKHDLKFDTQKGSCSRPRPTERMPKLATVYSCMDNQRFNR